MVRSSDISSLLTCEICEERFTLPPGPRVPLQLPCSHNFCSSCIKSLPRADQAHHRRCPLDETEVAVMHVSVLPEFDFIIGALRQEAYKAGIAQGAGSAFPPCPQHPNRELEGFCQTCDVPVCSSCVMFGHKDASHTVLPVPQAAELARDDVRASAITEIKERIESLEKLEDQVRGRRREVQAQATELEGKIMEWRTALIKAVEERTDQLGQSVRGEAERKDLALAAQEGAAGRRKETLELLLSKAEAKVQEGDLEVLRAVKGVKAELEGSREGREAETAAPVEHANLFFALRPRDERLLERLRSAAAAGSVVGSPDHTTVEGWGRLTIGEPMTLTIRTACEDGKPLTYGGAAGGVHAAFEPAEGVTAVRLDDKGDGTYGLTFTPLPVLREGTLKVIVMSGDRQVKGSPIELPAYELKWQQLHGLTQSKAGMLTSQYSGYGTSRWIWALGAPLHRSAIAYWKLQVMVPSSSLKVGLVTSATINDPNVHGVPASYSFRPDGNVHRGDATPRTGGQRFGTNDFVVLRLDRPAGRLTMRINRDPNRTAVIEGIPNTGNVWPFVMDHQSQSLKIVSVGPMEPEDRIV